MADQNSVVESKYYSGQGVVYIASRDSNGDPTGFDHLGNVCDLTISIDVEEFEHKECITGSRAIDLSLITETNVNVEFVMESMTAANLEDFLYGDVTSVSAASVSSLIVRGQLGKTVTTEHLNISSVVLISAATGTATFSSVIAGNSVTVDGTVYLASATATATDEFLVGATDAVTAANLVTVVNATAGRTHEAVIGSTTSIVQFNALVPATALNTLTLVENTTASTIVVSAATLLGSATGVLGTDYSINDTGGSLLIKSTSTIFPTGTSSIDLAYSHTAHEQVEALTQSKPERWLRFEGLNTARSLTPVVVDIFKFSPSPLAELNLISEEITQMTITGKALVDVLRTTGSQFFRELIDES